MKNKGFSLIELLIVIAVLSVIAGIVIPNITLYTKTANNETATNGTATNNLTLYWELLSQPISTLNLTELNFMVARYRLQAATRGDECCAILALIYQNQIIISLLSEGKEQP